MAKKATAAKATAKTKKTDTPAPAGFNPNQHRQFVVNATYKGLRDQCYQPMVAAAMLHSLGVSIDEGQEAATAYGDTK